MSKCLINIVSLLRQSSYNLQHLRENKSKLIAVADMCLQFLQ